jgi:hypothetical protein
MTARTTPREAAFLSRCSQQAQDLQGVAAAAQDALQIGTADPLTPEAEELRSPRRLGTSDRQVAAGSRGRVAPNAGEDIVGRN